MKKLILLLTIAALFSVNNSSWGQRRIGSETINLTSISKNEVIKFVSGSSPQLKNDYSVSILLATPGSSVTLNADATAGIGTAGLYSAGSPASKSFFIYFLLCRRWQTPLLMDQHLETSQFNLGSL